MRKSSSLFLFLPLFPFSKTNPFFESAIFNFSLNNLVTISCGKTIKKKYKIFLGTVSSENIVFMWREWREIAFISIGNIVVRKIFLQLIGKRCEK